MKLSQKEKKKVGLILTKALRFQDRARSEPAKAGEEIYLTSQALIILQECPIRLLKVQFLVLMILEEVQVEGKSSRKVRRRIERIVGRRTTGKIAEITSRAELI